MNDTSPLRPALGEVLQEGERAEETNRGLSDPIARAADRPLKRTREELLDLQDVLEKHALGGEL